MTKHVLMIGLTAVGGLLALGSLAPIRPAEKSAPDISRYTVKRVLGRIRVDGVLDEPSWKAAAGTGPFMLNDGTGLHATKTEAKMLWYDQNLYFCYQCEDT